MRLLVHLRPGEKDFYVRLVRMAYPNAEITTVSDIKHNGDIWFGKYLYSNPAIDQQYFSDDVTEDIRLRCRFLRSTDKKVAYRLINNLAYGLKQYFAQHNFDAVVGGLIDCYTQDILERITKEHDIPYISFVGHFFKGYCRISARGELVKLPRIVTKEEVDVVLQQVLAESYKPEFKLNKPKSVSYMLYFYSRELFKKHFYFPFRKIIERDHLNYHYNTTLPADWRLSSVISKKINSYFSNIKEIPEQVFSNAVYLPLHFTPEATVDYWVDNPLFALQNETIFDIIENTPAHINFLIKEHPAMYMRRSIDFYESLKSYNNVILIHPYESSNALLNKVENILVFTGSVGVEALLRNKRVLTLTNNYYSNLHPNISKINKITDDALNKELENYPPEQFIHDLLQGLFKAKFYNDKSMFDSDIEAMSNNLKNYLEALNKEYTSENK